jgi:hypothetical protein
MLMKANAINTKNADDLILDTTDTPDPGNRGFIYHYRVDTAIGSMKNAP